MSRSRWIHRADRPVTHAEDCDCSACWSQLAVVPDPPAGAEWSSWRIEGDVSVGAFDPTLAMDWTGLHPPEES